MEYGAIISILLALQVSITGFWAAKTYAHERRLTVMETRCQERHPVRQGG